MFMTTNSKAVVELGRVMATPNALERVSLGVITEALNRHGNGDWGEVCEQDREENDLSAREGFRILSVHRSQDGEKFWIITEGDRSVTTVLMPEDY
jgi:hypothetical protein